MLFDVSVRFGVVLLFLSGWNIDVGLLKSKLFLPRYYYLTVDMLTQLLRRLPSSARDGFLWAISRVEQPFVKCPFGLEEEPSFPCSTVGQYFTKDDTAFCFTQDISFFSPSLVSVLFSTTPSRPCQSSYLFDLCFTQSTVPVIPASHCEDICSPLLSNLWYQNSVIFFNNTCCLWNSMLPSFIS